MIYPYECDRCDLAFQIEKSMAEATELELCPDCGVELTRIFVAPSVLILGDPLPMGKRGVNLAQGTRSAVSQEKLYGRLMAKNKQRARARKLNKHGDGSVRMAGQIPRELYMARTQQYGKHYWTDGGKKALKRDGLSFED